MMSNVLSRRMGRAAVLVLLATAAACSRPAGTGNAPAGGEGAASAPQAGQAGAGKADAQSNRMVVYKTPTCGCCRAWVERMQAEGFTVEVHDQPDVAPVKREHGVPGHLESCHTALVGGYVVEGHVPSDVIRKMLRERPQVAGIAVPGMPAGSPGMEIPSGRKDPYDIIAFTRDGKVSVYESR